MTIITGDFGEALFTVDRFSKFPPELREEVFWTIGNRDDISNITRASPVMYRQSKISKTRLLRPLLRREFPGDLLQDAIAVITFPPLANYDVEEATVMRTNHLTAWGRKELPDPLLGCSDQPILAFNSLYRCIRGYINDYISKATSRDLRVSHLRLPAWVHQSFKDEALDNMLKEPSPHTITSINLVSQTEKYRLLQAFLRYELLCKALQPRPLRHLEPDEHNQLSRRRDGPVFDPYLSLNLHPLQLTIQREWDWSFLSRFEKDPTTVARQDWLQDTYKCVHEYVVCVHGTLLTRIKSNRFVDNLPLPNACQQRELIFQPETYPEGIAGGRRFLSLLAGFGFDLLGSFLASEKSTLVPTLICFYKQYLYRVPDYQPGQPLGIHGMGGDDDDSIPKIWKDVFDVIHRRYATSFEPWRLTMWCLYRQRAWAFFDDLGYYPASCNEDRPTQGWEDFRGPLLTPQERATTLYYSRFVKAAYEAFYSKESAATTSANESQASDLLPEDFRTGQISVYPSLQARMFSFWQRDQLLLNDEVSPHSALRSCRI
ncbi:hypothetical protein F4819DRAFT_491582 [Hypoxylon fuscum]|nr:hypothetical protein F4819DRAFT_491582 [Hypoxylon fuscum]